MTIKFPLLLSLLLGLAGLPCAFGQVSFPNPSPQQTIRQDFGLSGIELVYSRPGVKGRRMLGNVEPYDSVWRMGANAATKISFRSPVVIRGNRIDSGTYVFYAIPRPKTWTIIVNKGLKNWGSDQYQASDDVCRFDVDRQPSGRFTETLTFQFENVNAERCELVMTWEDWLIRIPIEAPLREELRRQIEANLKSDKPVYWYAAQFYYEYDRDLPKALDAINQAIVTGEQRGLKPYWYYHYKARILKDLNRKAEAIEAANVSTRLAREHGNRNNYLKLNEELIRSMK